MHANSFRLYNIYRVQMKAQNRILFLPISYLSHVFDDIFLRSKEEDLTKTYFEARRIIFRCIYHTSGKLMGFPLKNLGKSITFSSLWRQIYVLAASVLSSCRITTPPPPRPVPFRYSMIKVMKKKRNQEWPKNIQQSGFDNQEFGSRVSIRKIIFWIVTYHFEIWPLGKLFFKQSLF